jgi:hypothetical protein
VSCIGCRDAPTPPHDNSPAIVAERRAEYVGSQSCEECHRAECWGHSLSGHADTFRETALNSEFAALDGEKFTDADRGGEFLYTYLAETGLSVQYPEKFGEDAFPLPYALGSGRHAVTFLTLLPNEFGQTVGVEHRVSQFEDGRLARTPGATADPARQDVEHFGEILVGEELQDCINCHTTTADIVGTKIQNLRPHVDCERCHGPASRHLDAAAARERDQRIDFGKGQHTSMDELRMCGACHRLPEMLSDTPLVRTNPRLARYQPVGLLQSACLKASDGALRCTTCHDPHARADALSREEYSEACQTCHQQRAVADCPQQAERSNCIACHMPLVEVHPQVQFHDHWIRVRDAADPPTVETSLPN